MRNSILISITALIALAIVVGGFNRLAVDHGNADTFVTFLATIGALGVPAYIGMIKAGQAHAKASEVADKVDEARDVAATAADAAQQAENNTNGKMAQQFEQLRSMITEVDHKMTTHLLDHTQGGS
jgi:hypothetical protein